jgi:hypothetical protein
VRSRRKSSRKTACSTSGRCVKHPTDCSMPHRPEGQLFAIKPTDRTKSSSTATRITC